MKVKNINCLLNSISIGLVFFMAFFLSLSCSKDKNPVKPSSIDKTGTVKDIDSNIYKTVKIGDKWWMAENLKVTKYRNGDLIPAITDTLEWANLSTGAYCNYNNDLINVVTYGRLYNWYAVTDNRGIAPAGWHVPSNAEWQTLIDFLGDSTIAGGKMKETGYEHWSSPNTGATNSSGFSALPGGFRYRYKGSFDDMGYLATFWSSTETSDINAWNRILYWDHPEVNRYNHYEKGDGFSVRCAKD
jgi:uncharacterized protein (TIGR02145 family)